MGKRWRMWSSVVLAAVMVLGFAMAASAGVWPAEGIQDKPRNGSAEARFVQFGFTPDDPYYSPGPAGSGYEKGQWHLNNSFGYPSINVQGAWNAGYTGSGIVLGIVDDSFETAHADLAPNYLPAYSYNFGSYTTGQPPNDPNPVHNSDIHGISVAGVAGARGGNSQGVTGVAPYVGLAGLRVDFRNQSWQMFADATTHRTDVIKVKNHSYGMSVGYVSTPLLVSANRQAAADGVVNVRAAGNSSTNANSLAAQADRTALTVAALSADGKASWYTNFGANVFVTAPSSDGSDNPGIVTTDRTGLLGYGGITSDDAYTNAFGGTSSSSAAVAGAVALILQANPSLDIRGVKHVLAETSVKVDAANPNWHTNAAGYEFNPYYGFGLIDVTAAVQYAATFGGLLAETLFGTGQVVVNEMIPDLGSPVSRMFTIIDNKLLESVEVDIALSGNIYWADFDIILTSPLGTSSQLGYVYEGGQGAVDRWEFSSAEFWGENSSGLWTLTMQDRWEGDVATWDSFEFTGYAAIPEPATLILLGVGLLSLVGYAKKKVTT